MLVSTDKAVEPKNFMGQSKALAEWVASLNPNKYALIAILAAIYVVLGTALDGISMILLTTSIVLPMIEILALAKRGAGELVREAGLRIISLAMAEETGKRKVCAIIQMMQMVGWSVVE